MKTIRLLACLLVFSVSVKAQEKKAETKPLYRITPAEAAAINKGLEKELPREKGKSTEAVSIDTKTNKAVISTVTENGTIKREEKDLLTPKK